jgi:hypothetical protein
MKVDELLLSNSSQQEYGKIRSWYREKPENVRKPTIQEEETTRKEYETLYRMQTSEGDKILINYTQTLISDAPPTEIEIINVRRSMKLGKAPGGSKMRTEHIRMRMLESRKPPEERDESKVNAWNVILTLINKAFCGKEIPKYFGTGILVLIPKGVQDQPFWK